MSGIGLSRCASSRAAARVVDGFRFAQPILHIFIRLPDCRPAAPGQYCRGGGPGGRAVAPGGGAGGGGPLGGAILTVVVLPSGVATVSPGCRVGSLLASRVTSP